MWLTSGLNSHGAPRATDARSSTLTVRLGSGRSTTLLGRVRGLAAVARERAERVVERHEREAEREHRGDDAGELPWELAIDGVGHGRQSRG